MHAQKLEQRIRQRVSRAIGDFDLIEEGDRILVCLSGGKDSYTMLTLLRTLRSVAPIDFELVAFHLDQGQPGYPPEVMEQYLGNYSDIEIAVIREDTYSIVRETLDEGATPCSLCSRLRRGIMYRYAQMHRCNKIALGHHRDDTIETLLLNLFHTGQMQAMPAKYTTDDGRFDVIRPLIYVAESDIVQFAELQDYPIIPCNLCGSLAGRRNWVKGLLGEIEETVPQARNSMLAALGNVKRTHLLDRSLLTTTSQESETE